jgi:sugar phosphate isomerase/epimerase
MLAQTAAAGIAAAFPLASVAAEPASRSAGSGPFRYCLNMATLMGYKLSLGRQVEIAAAAGWQAIEPWIQDIQRWQAEGRSLDDVKKQIADTGLEVASAIGFAPWAVDDAQQRAAGMEQLRRDMDLLRRIGGTRIAAPPAGINRGPAVDLRRIAERYRAVLELGREMGVRPQLEIWGSSANLSRVGEAACVAAEANHPDACLLLDVYHIYRGGSGFEGLRLLNGAAMHAFHINDYPAEPAREELTDAHRVYPGDGVAPMDDILRTLHETGFRGLLSLELFNREYWKQEPLAVARTGLEKTRAAVERALR